MGVLVYAESENNIIKKSALEAVSYGKALAEKIGSSLNCVVINCSEPNILKQYGTDKIFNMLAIKLLLLHSIGNCLNEYICTSLKPFIKCISFKDVFEKGVL